MSLQNVGPMETTVDEVARVLAPSGRFVIAITHPLNTAGDFASGSDDNDRPYVIEGSWFERRWITRPAVRGGYTMRFHFEHRPLHAYTDALADAGFLIERLRELGEPDPSDKWSRIPLFLHIRAVRT